MRSIAELLAALPDDQARDRVLRWSAEHFRVTSGAFLLVTDDRQRPAATSGGGQADPALTVDDDLFDEPRARKPSSLHCDDSVGDLLAPGIEQIDAERLAIDVDILERETIDDGALAIAAADIEGEPQARPAGGLESLVRDFVADFQRLAVEWQTA